MIAQANPRLRPELSVRIAAPEGTQFAWQSTTLRYGSPDPVLYARDNFTEMDIRSVGQSLRAEYRAHRPRKGARDEWVHTRPIKGFLDTTIQLFGVKSQQVRIEPLMPDDLVSDSQQTTVFFRERLVACGGGQTPSSEQIPVWFEDGGLQYTLASRRVNIGHALGTLTVMIMEN